MQATTELTATTRTAEPGAADAGTETGDRLARLERGLARLAPTAGPAWFAVTLLALAATVVKPIDGYDEGIVLTDSMLVLEGALPYRDFYTNYPPGIFMLVAGLWKLTGVSVLVARALGVATAGVLALGAGRLARRLAGTGYGWFSAGLVLGLLRDVGPAPRAWLVALACAFWACELLLQADERPTKAGWRWAAAGLLLGLVGAFRHDLFLYVGAGLAALSLVWTRCGGRRPRLGAAALLALTAVVPLALVWGPVLAAAPWAHVRGDLYVEMVEHVMPARSLPVAGMLGDVRLYAVLGAPVAALAALAPGLRSRAPGLRSRELGLLAVLSLAALPAALRRTDVPHVLYAIAPAAALLPALGRRALAAALGEVHARRVATAALALVALPNLHTPWPKHRADLDWSVTSAATGRVPAASLEGRREVLDFVAARTAPGEPIFVGQRRHDLVHCNEMDLYFLAARPGGTRCMQFDPGLVTRADVQAAMTSELERRRVRVCVLRDCGHAAEPNLSVVPGSDTLDRFLAEAFEPALEVGDYLVLKRR